MPKLTVKDLIIKLQACDPDAIVVAPSTNFELGGSIVDAHVTEYEGVMENQGFRDAFDGGSYSKNVYTIALESDKKKRIKLVRIGG